MQNLSHKVIFSLLLLFIAGPSFAFGQEGHIRGKVKDENNKPLKNVGVVVENSPLTTRTDEKGEFYLDLPAKVQVLQFTLSKYDTARNQVKVRPGATEVIYVTMFEASVRIGTQEITDNADAKNVQDADNPFMEIFSVEPKELTKMPSFKMDISSKLATLPGVITNNEFSSQYRVRGGNFDENLVYVNDIEIYRPFLTRSGQQEGLGFVNPNLAANVSFSAGGFESKYADRLSSVLDVTYKQPNKFHGSAGMGIINQNFHLEGSSKNRVDSTRPGKFTFLFGARRFATTYLLNSLDVQGDYKPSFYDAQTMLTYTPSTQRKAPKIVERKNGKRDTIYYPRERFKLYALGNFSYNNYRVVPTGRETQFGTIQQVIRLRVAFIGEDRLTYTTGQGALLLEHRPNLKIKLKYILSGFITSEAELFDVEGGYWLSDVNTNFGNEGFNEVIFDRGIGTNYRRARNYLTGMVFAAEHRGEWFPGDNYRHRVQWGARVQRQIIRDELHEWNGVDSAGYFNLKELIDGSTTLESNQYKAFIQDNWKLNRHNTLRLVYGSRVVYNELNNEIFASPRVAFVFNPTAKKVNTDTMSQATYKKYMRRKYQLRVASGMYQQPAFYREMRARDGTVNSNVKAQKAAHFIVGGDYQFKIWNRPFKLFAEAYYKYLWDLVPYEVDNVRIRYYPNHTAVGYATGLDVKVIGPFIKGIDSWVSLSLLKTQEDVLGDTVGWISRPTDQRFAFSMYFQDELPINPTYKVHINFVYGSGLRFGPPGNLENRTVFSVPAYNRVDLGFSKMIMFKTAEERKRKWGFESLWLTAEVFNLFQRANTVSYIWVKDIFNTQFAVPNFLSARLFNFRMVVRF